MDLVPPNVTNPNSQSFGVKFGFKDAQEKATSVIREYYCDHIVTTL